MSELEALIPQVLEVVPTVQDATAVLLEDIQTTFSSNCIGTGEKHIQMQSQDPSPEANRTLP